MTTVQRMQTVVALRSATKMTYRRLLIRLKCLSRRQQPRREGHPHAEPSSEDRHNNRIVKQEQNGKLVIFDQHSNRQGEYDPKTNVTKDKHGNRVGLATSDDAAATQ